MDLPLSLPLYVYKFGGGGRGWISRREHRVAWRLGSGISGLEPQPQPIEWEATANWTSNRLSPSGENHSCSELFRRLQARIGSSCQQLAMRRRWNPHLLPIRECTGRRGDKRNADSLTTREEAILPPVKGCTSVAYLIPLWGIKHRWDMLNFQLCVFCIS